MKKGIMHIITVGCGKMVKALETACNVSEVSHAPFNPNGSRIASSVAVHFGSGRQFAELHSYCSERCIPIIQGSTGQKLPERIGTPIVEAPNLALPIVYLMGVVRDVQFRFETMGLSKCKVQESHQATKKSVAGTAIKFAEAIKLNPEEIFQFREPDVQRRLGVPEEHLERHGYHWIKWAFPDIEVEFVTKVHGLRPYALGALTVARGLLLELSTLDNKVYPVNNFI